jgi:hypothetical protein
MGTASVVHICMRLLLINLSSGRGCCEPVSGHEFLLFIPNGDNNAPGQIWRASAAPSRVIILFGVALQFWEFKAAADVCLLNSDS